MEINKKAYRDGYDNLLADTLSYQIDSTEDIDTFSDIVTTVNFLSSIFILAEADRNRLIEQCFQKMEGLNEPRSND